MRAGEPALAHAFEFALDDVLLQAEEVEPVRLHAAFEYFVEKTPQRLGGDRPATEAGDHVMHLGVESGVWSASTVMAWADDPKSAAEVPPPASATYVCPMHPQIQATFPGSCPICRMALKAKGSTAAVETSPMNHGDHIHQGLGMGSMDMGAMSCPQCTMSMPGMSMKGAPAASAAPGKVAPAGYRSTGGRRCGC